MQPITDRQRQVLDFVTSYLDEHGCPPTLREISSHIGTKGTATAIVHLEALEVITVARQSFKISTPETANIL